MIKKKWYLRISSHTAVQGGIVTSHSVGVNQRLSEHGCLCEIEIFIHWIFVDFTLETSIRNTQIGLRIYYSWHILLMIKIPLSLEKHVKIWVNTRHSFWRVQRDSQSHLGQKASVVLWQWKKYWEEFGVWVFWATVCFNVKAMRKGFKESGLFEMKSLSLWLEPLLDPQPRNWNELKLTFFKNV